MQIEYDKQAQATYIRLRRGKVAKTIKLQDDLIVDLDKNSEILGIEILGLLGALSERKGSFRIPVSVH